MNNSSLRRELVLPYVLLVIFVSAAIGWVSYRAGEDAVTTLSHRLLIDMVDRIGSATEQHLDGAVRVLNAVDADPATVPVPQPFPLDVASLENRLWIASGLFMDVNHYVYFGGTDGRFVGIKRVNKDMVELNLREPNATRRNIYFTSRPGDRSRILRVDDFDPRQRPWYGVAAKQNKPVWSPVYSDFTTREPTLTLAKSVFRPDGTFAGVAATDVRLKALTDFLRTMKVSDNGIAFVIDGTGLVVASSGSELPFKMVKDAPQPMRVDEMKTPLIREAYAHVEEWKRQHANMNANGGNIIKARTESPQQILTATFDSTLGTSEIAARSLGGQYGVDWITVVAVPRSDFMGGVTRSFLQGIFIATICVLIALVLGLGILNRVLGDLRKLTSAAQKIGDGEPLPKLDIRRRDEIGQLAMTFSEMEHNLRIDKLTAVFNRASLIAQIAFLRRQLANKTGERPNFALLFIDLDHFKAVNDQYGHGAGDKVLVAVATRLKESVRVTDVVARYGGDEFVVLLKGVTAGADVVAMEEKIRSIVEAPVRLDHGEASVGVSIGWALFPDDGEDVDALLKIADQRMFDTKKNRKAAR
jgi:diguanylate cyclase